MKRAPKQIPCPSEQAREVLTEKLNLVKSLLNTNMYNAIIIALNQIIESKINFK